MPSPREHVGSEGVAEDAFDPLDEETIAATLSLGDSDAAAQVSTVTRREVAKVIG